jgi:hypothetical protein
MSAWEFVLEGSSRRSYGTPGKMNFKKQKAAINMRERLMLPDHEVLQKSLPEDVVYFLVRSGFV